MGGNHFIFANYKKAYETRGYEAKILIIKKEKKLSLANAIAPVVSSQPHVILQTITMPKTEAESNPVST
jgi:hypothetical protein